MAGRVSTGEEPTAVPGPPPDAAVASIYAPLRRSLFRWLWIASLASNLGTWMQNVGATWLMTELSASALMIALVQAATNLPVFLLAVPSGALADIVDRRGLLLAAQGWMLLVAAALAAAAYAGLLTPWLLLGLTFLLGLGSALNAPAWQATTPDLVPRAEVPAAVALAGVSMNVARAVGPAVGGLVIAAAGPAAAFLLNALSFLGVLFVLARWHRPREDTALPAERLVGAMRAGLRYVRHSPAFRAVLVRAAAYVVGASSLTALLPVLIKQDTGLGPAHYGVLLACFGAGAVVGVVLLPALARLLDPDRTLMASTLVLAAATLGVAWLPYYSLWCGLMVPAGAAWLAALTRLNAAAQASAPRWVRARALAVYLLVFFGGMAAGSMLWGYVADRAGAPLTLTASAVWLLVGLLAGPRFPLPRGEGGDLEPSRHWPEMAAVPGLEHDRGPVLVTVEYRIDPTRAGEFMAAVQPLGQSRLRDGALWWEAFQDAADPARLVEAFLVESLAEHMRQHERVTGADRVVQERVRSFHHADTPPAVSHLVAGLERPTLEPPGRSAGTEGLEGEAPVGGPGVG